MSKKPPKDKDKRLSFPGAGKGKGARGGRAAPKTDAEGMRLNPRQRAFAEHYVQSANATESARRAGYNGSENTLATTGHDLLRNPKVAAYLKELQAEVSGPRILSAKERLEILSSIVEGTAKGESTFFGEPVVTRPGFNDRIRASELISKMQGELLEKRQVEGGISVRIVRGNSAPSAIGEKVEDE